MRKTYAFASLLALMTIALAARGFADDQKDSGVAIGAKAPDFSLQDQNGKVVSLHDSLGKDCRSGMDQSRMPHRPAALCRQNHADS